MRYQYCPSDPARFATNLRREQGKPNLKWDSARGQDTLLVQTPFGAAAEGEMEELCRLMEGPALPADRYIEVKPRVWVRLITAAEKVRLGGCPIHTEASTYTVFACHTQGEVCAVYAPQPDQVMISAACNVPMQAHVEVREEVRGEGLFKKRLAPTGYYILDFPRDLAGGYRDGDLVCRVGALEVPVTGQMLALGRAYVKSDARPELLSRNRGLELV